MDLDFRRFTQNARLFSSAGQYANSLLACSFNLGEGQAPSAASFKPHLVFEAIRSKFHAHANNIPARTVTISDTKILKFILLDFSAHEVVSFADFATPSDLPLTWSNVRTVVARVCDNLAMVFGPDLPMAIMASLHQLCEIKDLDTPHLSLQVALRVLENRLFVANKNPLFATSIPDDGQPLAPKLEAYLRFHHDDLDLRRAGQQDALPMVVVVPAQSGAAVNNKRKYNGPVPPLVPGKHPVMSLRSAAGGGGGGGANSMVLSPNAKHLDAQATAWHRDFMATHPSLKGKLPCLYWLANKGHCANLAAGTPCNNTHNSKPHVNGPEVQALMNEITVWLAKDPRKRFG
jgi:hypothetical protein